MFYDIKERKELGIHGPVIYKKSKHSKVGEKKVSSCCNRLTYQYLRYMHGVELSHQKGHLKGHLRTAGRDREGRRKK